MTTRVKAIHLPTTVRCSQGEPFEQFAAMGCRMIRCTKESDCNIVVMPEGWDLVTDEESALYIQDNRGRVRVIVGRLATSDTNWCADVLRYWQYRPNAGQLSARERQIWDAAHAVRVGADILHSPLTVHFREFFSLKTEVSEVETDDSVRLSFEISVSTANGDSVLTRVINLPYQSAAERVVRAEQGYGVMAEILRTFYPPGTRRVTAYWEN